MGIRVQEEKKEEEVRGLLERRPGKASLTRGHLSQDPKEAKEGAMWGPEGGCFTQREQPVQRPMYMCAHVFRA